MQQFSTMAVCWILAKLISTVALKISLQPGICCCSVFPKMYARCIRK